MNPLKAIFAPIGHFFEDVWNKLKSGNFGGAEQELMQMAAKYGPEALTALKTVSSLAPNKTESELIALGEKYQLNTSGVDLNDPAAVQAFVLVCAEKELHKLIPVIPESVLDYVVQFAFAAMSKTPVASAASTRITPSTPAS